VAEAHPLGNFTINRYSRLDLYSDAVRIRYVLDMAEIPAFQETPQIDTNGDGDLSQSESDAYLAVKANEIVDNLQLETDGSRNGLTIISSTIGYPEGQAGLRTLRLNLLMETPISGSDVQLEYHDGNYSDRVGWKEIVVRPADGVVLNGSNAPANDVSAELTSYPADLISSPLDVSSATVSYSPSAGTNAPPLDETSRGLAVAPKAAPERAGGAFASLISRNSGGPIIILSLLLALAFGALHALEPGHGKTFVAAYFVGVRGTVRQALGLGLIVAFTHTIGVLLIGLVTLFGSQYVVPEKLYPWLTLASGVMVLALGVRLIVARAGGPAALRQFRAVLKRGDVKLEHAHDHHHAHSQGGAPPWKALIALGLADGLTPSPSALIVLLAAVSLQRIELGLLLIVSFSVGLAAVLTLISLSLVYVRRLLDWFGRTRGPFGPLGQTGAIGNGAAIGALVRFAPVGGAFGLLGVGILLTVRALSQPGLPIF
jgi:ABC-type nickel/cobalt efflux system permease component RcnA